VTYRTLKRQFDLDDDTLEDLKEELLYSQPQVVDDEGKGSFGRAKQKQSQSQNHPLNLYSRLPRPN
jgi:hypothetical protein